MLSLAGIYPIVPTPFDAEGRVDAESIADLARFMAGLGVQGLAVLGVMGEAHKLTEAEQAAVITAFRRALPAGQALVVGAGAGATDPAVASARRAADLGADALLVAPPRVQDDEAIAAYYGRVGRATPLPIVVHDYPPATGVVLSVPLIARLHREIPTVRYVKVEDPPTGPKIDALRAAAGPGLGAFGALGGLYAFEELDRGAVGLMTGFAYPETLVRLRARLLAGDRTGALDLFCEVLPLIRFEFQPGVGLSLRKHILVQRGAIRHATVRHPGPVADPRTLAQLGLLLDRLRERGVIDGAAAGDGAGSGGAGAARGAGE